MEKEKRQDKRIQLRDTLWPDAQDNVWHKGVSAWTLVPRLMPLVLHLISDLSPKGNPALTYFELWARSKDDGFITIADESACAFAAGYTSTRAQRTWREQIWKLQELGFIRVVKNGNHEIGHILLVNPVKVCCDLHKAHKGRPEWWNAFVTRAVETGFPLE